MSRPIMGTEDIPHREYNPDGTYTETTITIEIPKAGTKFGTFKGKWASCARCDVSLPQVEMNQIGGKWFCSKYKCYESKLAEIAKQES